MPTFEKNGYCVVEWAVPEDVVAETRRMLLLEIVKYGLPKETFDEYHNTKAWFPTLRPYVEHLADYVPSQFKKGTMCEPQILMHFPDENLEYEVKPHRDQEPEWANGRKYTAIAGVALTDSNEHDGGLMAWGNKDKPKDEPKSVSLIAGDIVVFSPQLWHSGGLNASDAIRAMIYFRWIEAENA